MKTDFLHSVGHKIKVARIKAGLSQADLAKRIRVSQQLISIYENGEQSIRIKTLKDIADECNVSTYFFLAESETVVQLVYLSECLQPDLLECGYEQIQSLMKVQNHREVAD